jgi:hypothetical protein
MDLSEFDLTILDSLDAKVIIIVIRARLHWLSPWANRMQSILCRASFLLSLGHWWKMQQQQQQTLEILVF